MVAGLFSPAMLAMMFYVELAQISIAQAHAVALKYVCTSHPDASCAYSLERPLSVQFASGLSSLIGEPCAREYQC
eukprot:2912578-Amphidinium_carterae.2